MSNYIKHINTLTDRQARIVISDDNWLEDSAIEQLKKTMELKGMRCGVGMPDLHPGKGQPIGAAFVTEGCIYPHLIGSDIGCGMGLWQLDITTQKIKLDKWEKQLDHLDENWNGDITQYLADKNITTDDIFLLSENNKLGTIGGGNHFSELQKVDTIIDEAEFSNSGIDKKRVVLLAHSGSRGLGQKILRNHVDHLGAEAISTATDNSQFTLYLERHNYAEQWASANRELIALRFCKALKAKPTKLLDINHNMVKPLSTQEIAAMQLAVRDNNETQNYWIHRKGASPTDQGLVMIPGSRGSLSYLVKPMTSHSKRLALGGFSLAHGAGRKWKRSDVRGRLKNRYTVKDLEKTALGSRVICKQRDLLYQEAPQAYKNISVVVSDLVAAGMISVVATFKPLITYKTRRT